ncbi:DUF4300 family protein [Peptoniphilus raoultii]|uniref:DUF4300 family protein n=1 Tax=Peptoniphilus raoultii TaxID=1776387 RepID=UPI0008D8DE7C|nr:DUF4300 family protein [Peptoniphilus raoultii]
MKLRKPLSKWEYPSKNQRQLSDYLMEKYDVECNQDVTRPFIMDGLKILKDFRQNSKNKLVI